MIERKFVSQNFKEFQIKEFIKKSLNRVGLSGVKLQRTSLGEKLIIVASRPGLIVGRGGSTIKALTKTLKEKFHLENPQIEIEEIKDFSSDANIVAESIVSQLERFGSQRFKGIGHKTLDQIMRSGALGVEILISGKIPSARAKTWRFADGYMKKCGDIAISGVNIAKSFANLKTGIVGIQVRIMPSTTVLPDQILFNKRDKVLAAPIVHETKDESLEKEVAKKESKDVKEEKKSTKKSTKKTTKKSSKKSAKKTTKKTVTKKAKEEKADSKEVVEKVESSEGESR